jgi:hypothetical protein
MQSEAIENVTEPLEQIDVCERQPYQAPSLVRIELKKTEAGAAGTADSGLFS